MKNVIIFGAPGSGKGTYSAEIAERYGMKHISTGDVLREEIASKSAKGQEIASIINKGNLIPDEMMLDILVGVMDKTDSHNGVIFDGYPRTVPQAEAMKRLFAERGEDMGVMIELHVDEETLMERLLARAEKEGRADDNAETIKMRFQVYHKQTEPLSAWFDKEGMLHAFTWKGSKEQMLGEIFEFLDSLA